MSTIEMGVDTFGDVTVDRGGPAAFRRRACSATSSPRRSWRIEWAWTSSAWVSTIARTSRSARRRSCSPRSPPAPSASAWAPPSRCSAPTTRSGCTSASPPSTPSPNGRAEVILGRGSFTESYPLFGYSLDDYDTLFEEKLAIFAALRDADRTGEPVRWKGTVRPPLDGVRVYPRIERPPLSTWVGVGGSPESVVRAARYRFPLTLAIIGGDPRRFAPYVELYHRALAQLGAESLPVGVHSPGHIADTDARGAGGALAALRGHAEPDRRASAAGRRRIARSSSARSQRARSMSARRRPSPARSPQRSARSARRASISSTAPARWGTTGCCGASSSMGAR